MKAKVVRFALYPKENPVGYAVGFEVTLSGNIFYKDTVVNFDDVLEGTEESFVAAAWITIKPELEAKREELQNRSSFLNTIWYDESPVEEEEPEDPPVEETPVGE